MTNLFVEGKEARVGLITTDGFRDVLEIGRASLVGQPVHLLSPLVPSTYLLVWLCGVELGEHQRFTIKWAVLSAMVLLLVGMVTTVIPLVGHAAR